MSVSNRPLPPQLKAKEAAAGLCQLSCDELIKPEQYGTKPLTQNQSQFIENNMQARIQNAKTVAEYDDARQNLDCFIKWRRKCIPELTNIEETRKRLSQSGKEMEKEMAEARAKETIISGGPPPVIPPQTKTVMTYANTPGVIVAETNPLNRKR